MTARAVRKPAPKRARSTKAAKVDARRPVKAKPARAKPSVGARRSTPRPSPVLCPVCGSKDVDSKGPDGPVKSAAKLVAFSVVPVTFPRMARAFSCRSCGYREEAHL